MKRSRYSDEQMAYALRQAESGTAQASCLPADRGPRIDAQAGQNYPKGMDPSAVSQPQLDTVARKPNTRPRQSLHRKTPAHILGSSVSMTH